MYKCIILKEDFKIKKEITYIFSMFGIYGNVILLTLIYGEVSSVKYVY